LKKTQQYEYAKKNRKIMSPGPKAYFRDEIFNNSKNSNSKKKQKDVFKELEKNYYKPMNKILF
jgi:hypothetical protein